MSFVDPNKAIEFKKRNQLAHMQHHSDSANCCSLQNKYYIDEKEFSSVDRAINNIITSRNYFRDNLTKFLDKVNQAQT